VASLIDQLINEIAVLTNVTSDNVRENFTQEQLEQLLLASKCDNVSSVSPILTDLSDISCSDSGSPSDLVREMGPIGLKYAQKSDFKKKEKEVIFEGNECLDAVQVVNDIVKEKLDKVMEYKILLSRMYEIQDNIAPLEYYFKERSNKMAEMLGDFKPILAEMKRILDIVTYYSNILIPTQQSIIINQLNNNNTLDSAIYNTAVREFERLTNNKDILQSRYDAESTKLKNVQSNYPKMTNTTFISFGDSNNLTTSEISTLTSEINKSVTSSNITKINKELHNYSEYISLDIKTPSGTSSDIISKPMIGFEINFQSIDFMMLDKENFDIQTGEKFVYKEKFIIKDNTLLLKNSFFNSGPGYTINNIDVNSDKSKGSLYTEYYNLLDDPTNNFFTLNERGLTSSISQLDPKLKGHDSITKKENQSEYFIKNMDTMQNFYKDFETTFEAKRKHVRSDIKTKYLATVKTQLEQIARMDIELLLTVGRINIFNKDGTSVIENSDGSSTTVNTGMHSSVDTVINSVSNANLIFSQRVTDLNEEIIRIEQLIESSKPTPDSIKLLLKQENSKCFEHIDKSDDASGGSQCSDTNDKLGSDPFFESLSGIDPTLPNFSQGCYWKEFAKLATLQGLFPIINDPTTFRYWPVGLIIPTPASLIKIPLPQIWIHLITISTPLGVLVIFLNINGIFISPIVFFVSSSGYKQHLITLRGSSKKFGYDKNDPLIKPLIQIPLNVQAALDMAKIGDNLNLDKVLTDKEKAKIEILKQKKEDAKILGDTVREHKAKKEADGMLKQAIDRVKPDSVKQQEASDAGEKVEEIVANIKQKIFKTMDDLGKPTTRRINKLKEKSVERESQLKTEKLASMEQGNRNRTKEINKELKSDGLKIDDKISAFIEDLLEYYDNITFPTIVLPRESDKLDPKPDTEDSTEDKSTEMSSSHDKEFMSNHAAKVKTIIGVAIAKHKGEIEDAISDIVLNIEEDTDKIKDALKSTIDKVIAKATGAGSSPVDPDVTATQLKAASKKAEDAAIYNIAAETEAADAILKANQQNLDADTKKKAIADADTKSKKAKKGKSEASKAYLSSLTDISKKLESARTKQTLSLTPAIIGLLAGASVTFDPFAKCCPGETFSIGFPFPPLVDIAMSAGTEIIKSKISDMSTPDLKSLFGGKPNIGARDIRLGLLNIVQKYIPDSISIPKPELNLKASTDMFSGILGGLSMPQVSVPAILGINQLKKKINIDLSIAKAPIRSALKSYLENNIKMNAQSLDTDFIYTSPNDIKSFMKKFIDSITEDIEVLLKSYYAIINAPNIKNGNGMELNVLESAVFKAPPFGPIAKALFIAKGQLSFAKKKSNAQFLISEDMLAIASGILKTVLSPIVLNPVAGLLVAAAGMTGTSDLIREIHPILAADDIPPWERLTMKNVLFLLFLDEFNSVAADQVGFFRAYL